MRTSGTIGTIVKAIIEAKRTFEPVTKDLKGQDGNRQFKYADLLGYMEATQQHLAQNGLVLVQTTGADAEGRVTLQSTLFHTSGEMICTDPTPVPYDTKTHDAKDLGGAITYLRRYQYAAILGLAQEDNAGESGQQAKASYQAPRPAPVQQKTVVVTPNQQSTPQADRFAPPPLSDEDVPMFPPNEFADQVPGPVNFGPGAYVIPFGRDKGLRLDQISKDDLVSKIVWFQKKAAQDGKPLSGQAADFCKNAENYLNG